MLQPNNSSPTRTQRRKTATDSLDGSALPIATPTNAPTSAIIAGTTRAPPSPLLRLSPSVTANVDTKSRLPTLHQLVLAEVERLHVRHAGDDENSRRAVHVSGC